MTEAEKAANKYAGFKTCDKDGNNEGWSVSEDLYEAFLAGWAARGERDARLFEEGPLYQSQTFKGSTDDAVQLTFRVMQIIADNIRAESSDESAKELGLGSSQDNRGDAGKPRTNPPAQITTQDEVAPRMLELEMLISPLSAFGGMTALDYCHKHGPQYVLATLQRIYDWPVQTQDAGVFERTPEITKKVLAETQQEAAKAAEDMRVYGTGYFKASSDGTVERVDPFTVRKDDKE